MSQPPESTASPSSGRSPMVLIGVGTLVVVAVAIGAFLFFTRDTAPDELTLTEDSTPTTGEAAPEGDDPPAVEPIDVASLDGVWTVTAGEGDEETVAGYRIDEVFAQGAREATAYGRTTEVTGSMTVEAGQVTEGSFEVDMTTLQSDEDRRDNAIRDRGLQTNQFPTATFALTEPAAVPELVSGQVGALPVTGELTLHGVTQPITIDLNVKASGDLFIIQGSAPVVLADFEIEPPSIGGFVTVTDEGSFEFIVNLTQT